MWNYSLQRQVFSERLLSLDTLRRSAEKTTISPLPVSINFFTAYDMVWVIWCCKNDHWIFLNQWTGHKTLPTNIPKEVFSTVFFPQHELVQEVVSSLLCKKFYVALLPPAKEVCKRYVFTPVCHSVHGGGGCLPQSCSDTPPPGSRPLWEQTPPCVVQAGRCRQQAGGKHPTGMHTYLNCVHSNKIDLHLVCHKALLFQHKVTQQDGPLQSHSSFAQTR